MGDEATVALGFFDNRYYDTLVNRNWRNVPQIDDTPRTKNIWRRGNDNIALNVDMSTAFLIDTTEDPDGCVSCGRTSQR